VELEVELELELGMELTSSSMSEILIDLESPIESLCWRAVMASLIEERKSVVGTGVGAEANRGGRSLTQDGMVGEKNVVESRP